MKTNVFDFNRIGLLFQRYFVERFRSELIYWGIMAIVFMFLRNNMQSMSALIVIAGLFYAARFSKKIHHSGNGVAYFMIPASQLEKLTVAIVITSFYYLAMMMVTYIIGNLLGAALNNLLASFDFLNIHLFKQSSLQWIFFEGINHSSYTNPEITYKINDANFNVVTFQGAVSYFIGFFMSQSLFLLGGIYFRKNQTLKTFLVLILFFLFLAIVMLIEGKLILDVTSFTGKNFENWDGNLLANAAKIFYSLLPLYFWVVSYFRLTEKQV